MRFASDARRLAWALFASAFAFAGCRLFVDLDGLGDGPPPDGAASDGGSDVVDGSAFTDAPFDAPIDVVEEPLPDGGCPHLGGPTPLRVTNGPVSFCIDSTEVTREQYLAFLESNPNTSTQGPLCQWNSSFVPDQEWPYVPADKDLPVVGVDWCDAFAFCAWAGKRMCRGIGGTPLARADAFDPGKSEYTFACSRGGARQYPYGNLYNPQSCNGADKSAGRLLRVGSVPTCQGGFDGLFDMSGNAHEWIDACDSSGSDPAQHPCELTGSSFTHGEPDMACTKYETTTRSGTLFEFSFRCCSP
ncbi:MAG: SUMF1/EgtB/PvdO family nonheme iron enzyme [Labilithrix sp.]|nr:SUMF1/EgtB/PvdO family nonheme iron enzyme [Labilithrix sp.]